MWKKMKESGNVVKSERDFLGGGLIERRAGGMPALPRLADD
jgi:hypothetical protein